MRRTLKQKMYSILRWWDSLPHVSSVRTVLQWTVAVVGILILVLNHRETMLRKEKQEKDHRDAERQNQKLESWIKNLRA